MVKFLPPGLPLGTTTGTVTLPPGTTTGIVTLPLPLGSTTGTVMPAPLGTTTGTVTTLPPGTTTGTGTLPAPAPGLVVTLWLKIGSEIGAGVMVVVEPITISGARGEGEVREIGIVTGTAVGVRPGAPVIETVRTIRVRVVTPTVVVLTVPVC